jgi:hypothetical protein
MKRTLVMLLVAVTAFALGVGSSFYLRRSSVPQGWLVIIPDSSPTLFDIAAMKDDIPPPEPGRLEGKIKFLQRDAGIEIGYVLKLPMKANPISALPAKYRQETKLDNGFTIGPPDQVSWTGKFTFNLQDGDGFSLAKILSHDESIAGASDNQLQGVTEATVPESIAIRTKRIAVSFDAEKCNICDQ